MTLSVDSPHGDWTVGTSVNDLTALEFVEHALRHIPVPESQRDFDWYLTENGRRIPDDENIANGGDREFRLCMEMP